MSVTLVIVKHCPRCKLGIMAKGQFCWHCGDWCQCRQTARVDGKGTGG